MFLAFVTMQSPAPLLAQAVASAQIRGVVSDSQGGVIPNAKITVMQTDTGLVRKTISNSDGTYLLANLPVGQYRLDVMAAAFRTYEQSGIELHVGGSVGINVTLQVGSSSEHIEVTANAGMVEVQKPAISEVINQQSMVDLPLNGREAAQLLLLVGASASVTAGAPHSFDLHGTRSYILSVPYSVAGGQANANNWLLDGADNNSSAVNTSLPYPFPDALQEFEVNTSSRSARLGLHPGSVVNAVTKSGTDQFHGDLFEFLRNGDLNARNFFAATHDSLRRNQFGATAGGPIVKDKLCFFGGFQGTENRSSPPETISFVPTQAVLNGDFGSIQSGACQANGKAQTITDPATGQPFANNQVPVSRFNSSALALLKFLPVSSNPCGKVVYGKPTTGDEQQVIGRVDWNRSEKHSIFARYFIANYTNPTLFDGANVLPTQRTGLLERSQSATAGDTYTVSPTTVNSVHLAFTRLGIKRGSPPNYIGPNTLGINNVSVVPNYINITVAGDFGTGGTGGVYFAANNAFQVADDVDMIRGRHHLSFGFEYFRNQMNENNLFAQNGTYNFDGSQTGSPMLDFLLGDIGSLTQSGPELGAFRQSVLSLYGQDDIRVNSRLTVTAGLRWGPYLPTIDDRGRGNYFSQAAFAAGIKTNRYDNAPPGLLFNSDPGIPYRYANDRYLDLEPRVGIAWDPTGKGGQSVRASYSIIYDSPPTYWYTNWSDNPPWGAEITVPHPAGKLNDPWAGYPGGNPFPIPSKPSRTAPFIQGSIYQNSLLDAHLPYVQQWNISYQKQLGSDWLLSATYLGNKTTHLWIGIDQNPAVYMPGSCGAQPCSTLANTNQRRVLSLINPVSGAYYASMPNTYDGGNGEY
ncbi:MAG: carboxypeptidase regulatory-like domain-containing protein, partial [Acidobacteriota bacterium]|nr:carboxypeptidase regulatory-like domain-containing protein [Acidobacteriota bacterium]